MKNVYEFIQPSDSITFLAEDNKIAFVSALLLGRGQAGCRNTASEDENIPSMMICMNEKQCEETRLSYLGETLSEYLDKNKAKIVECFESFSYASVEERKMSDDAIAAITDEEKLKEFKNTHEDRNRSSMSQWVKSAWSYAESFKK